MIVSLAVSTFGSVDWEQRGAALAETLAVEQSDAHEVIRVHSSVGLADARNRAAAEASCDWLCFVDADDTLLPGFTSAMAVAAARHDGPALIQPATRFVGDAETPQMDERGLIRPHADLIAGNHLVIGTLVRRDQFLDVGGFDPDLDVLEDWDLWIRCWQDGAVIDSCPDAVYVVHVNADGRNLGAGRRRDEVANLIRSNYR